VWSFALQYKLSQAGSVTEQLNHMAIMDVHLGCGNGQLCNEWLASVQRSAVPSSAVQRRQDTAGQAQLLQGDGKHRNVVSPLAECQPPLAQGNQCMSINTSA
jgi:hypothetical protein